MQQSNQNQTGHIRPVPHTSPETVPHLAAADSPPRDRRVRRTREALHRALIELMMERDYRRISVQDILNRADVGRSTFYAHYRDKDDLLVVSCTDYLRSAVAATAAAEPDSLLAPIRTMFELAATHQDVYRVLLGPKVGAPVLRASRQMGADILADRLTGRLAVDDDDEFADTITYLSWALFGLLGAVTDPSRNLSAAEAYRRFHRLSNTGLTGLLQSDEQL